MVPGLLPSLDQLAIAPSSGANGSLNVAFNPNFGAFGAPTPGQTLATAAVPALLIAGFGFVLWLVSKK